tara:strand:- start:2368 stop:3000 length:633 start_codon:yes stop_codon:yes gene_type:complete
VKKSLVKLLIEHIDRSVVAEAQSIIDNNQYLKGQIITEESLIGSDKYVLWASDGGLQHIKERHQDKNKPGSLFVDGLDFRKVMGDLLQLKPNELQQDKIKWIAIKIKKPTGFSGLRSAPPEEINQMQDYEMPDSRGEVVKVAPGSRLPTNYISLVTRNIGTLKDGRILLSLITFYPGANIIDGIEVPSRRQDFTKAGLYFSLPPESPYLK